jgi:secondary thiamine-phosphate synthase enzyme
MVWSQCVVTLPPLTRGFHLITGTILKGVPEIEKVRVGLLNLFLQHTSASLTINENASPEVQDDLESLSNVLAPEDFPYRHSLEGPDDMPAHVKSSLFGASLVIPVRSGRLALGTWQGIYLCEHRDQGGRRQIIATLHGEPMR